MATATWGGATAKGGGGGGSKDPNVLELQEASRIRLLEPHAERWRQHAMRAPEDEEQFRSAVCPKGYDGRTNAVCPLCMKSHNEKGDQRFPISRRFATNVYDYESGSVKILVGGPQIFEEFDNVASVGIDPMSSDWIINKTGTGRQTKYKMIRGDSTPLPVEITPDMLHDLGKFAEVTSPERMFELLEELGIDYDSLETPQMTLTEAEAFQMPFGKHKGLTVEQVYASDKDYLEFIHNSKLEQGNHGDTVFVALHTVLEHYGDVEPLDVVQTAPPRPAAKPAPAAPAPTPAPAPVQAAPAPVVSPAVQVTLVGPDGSEVEVPASAADALRAAGYTDPKPPEPESVAEPADTDMVTVDISGTKAEMPYGSAKTLIATGTATLVEATQEAPAAPVEPEQPKVQLPSPGDMVQVKLKVVPTPIPMEWTAFQQLPPDQGQLVDADLQAAWDQERARIDRDDEKALAHDLSRTEPQVDPQEQAPPTGDALDPNLTVKNEAGRWTHPALDKDYATKGAVTQALNRLRTEGPSGSSAPAAPAGAAPATPSAPADGKEGKLNRARDLLAQQPEIQKDFNALLSLFQEVAGKRQITDFTESELDALIARLEAMQTSG